MVRPIHSATPSHVRSEHGRLKPQDAKGERVRKGDRVRVIGVPHLTGIPKDDELKTHAAFRHLRGKTKFIHGFDRYGHAEIFFTVRSGALAGSHIVCIEPELLLRQKSGHKPDIDVIPKGRSVQFRRGAASGP